MYETPFGSIFGADKPEDSDKPGFLKQDDDPSATLKRGTSSEHAPPVEAPQEQASAVAAEKPAPPPDIMQQMRERTEAAEKAEIYQPGSQGKAEAEPFAKTDPQFRAVTTIESLDPEVHAEQLKLLKHKNKQELKALERKLRSVERKTKAAKIYKDLLLHYSQLKVEDKLVLAKWIKKHFKAVKLLNKARKMKKLTLEAREALAALDVEIVHWESLSVLKKKGKNLSGKKKLKYFRPVKKVVRAKPTENMPPPQFQPRGKTAKMVKLAKHGVEIQGYGDAAADKVEIVKADNSKIVEKAKSAKKGVVQNFVDNLPDRRYYSNKRKAKREQDKISKQIEKNLYKASQYEWKKKEVQEQLVAAQEEYKETQDRIKLVLSKVKADDIDERITTVLSVLVESRPERFVAIKSLHAGLKDSFTRLSQLGQIEPVATAKPEVEAQRLLDEVTEESRAVVQELQSRQGALSTLQTEVSDAPAPCQFPP